MGEVTLNINANVQGALNGTEKLNKSVDELNKDTQAYNQRATAGFNQTGQAATQASQGVSKATQAFKLLGGAVAAAFSVGMILQWGKAILSSTGAGADAMERFRTGVERMGQALNTAIATADFSNLLQGLADAYREGKRYADVLDEIKARQAALGAFKSTLETLQAEQKLIARNAANSIEVRQAAIDKIVELEKQKLSETLNLQNTELDEALRAASVRTGISLEDEESLKRRKDLVLEWATAYGTATGTEAINAQLTEAAKLQAQLESLITTTQVYSGDIVTTVKNYDEYNKALKNLTPEEQRLLDLKRINIVISDQERDAINNAVGARAQSTTQSIEQETALQRLRNQLRTELLGEEEKKAKADKERTKSTVEENLASLDKYVEEANKKIFDIELGFGGEQSAEQYQKQIEDNLKAFNEAMESNPMFSDENGAQAKAYDDAQKLMQDNLAEFERIQQETWDNMQAFSEAHPLASALGFESEEQLQQIQEYGEQIMSFVNDMIDQQIEARTRLVDDWNQKIEEQEALVEREQEDKQEGLANNYESEKENLVKMQQIRDQAIKDREKYVKLQQAINTAESASSLIVASANILKGFSEIPLVGQILGLAAIATMLAGFITAQTKIRDAVQMEGGGQAKHGLLRGRRHSQGGIPIEAEDGEWFINRNSSLKYSPLLNAINKDDREGMRLFFDRQFINRMPQQRFDIDSSKKLGEIVRELKKGKADITYGPGYIIERIGGYTKKINLN